MPGHRTALACRRRSAQRMERQPDAAPPVLRFGLFLPISAKPRINATANRGASGA